MTTSYPTGLDTFATITGGQPRDGSGTSVRESTILTNLGDAIEAVQAELGLNPSGAFATVLLRFASLDLRRTVQTPAFAASFTPDATLGDIIKLGTMTANLTINAPTGGVTGQILTFMFTEDATGGRTFTFNAVFKKIATLVTTANKINTIRFFFDGTNWIEIGASVGI